MSPCFEGLDYSHTYPTVMKTSARQKKNQKQTKTQDQRIEQKKGINKVGDTQQVKHKSVNRETNPKKYTCLAKAVTVHIGDRETQEAFTKETIKVKPKDRDTLLRDLFRVFAIHGLSL